jgi:hypothetical protein
MNSDNLLGGPNPTLLPIGDLAQAALAAGGDPRTVVAQYPTSSLAWAMLSDQAWDQGDVIGSYAFARVGYHRGLDSLRKNGWKGYGPVPWSHEPNQGFLRCLQNLGRAAGEINESEEQVRIADFIMECDPTLG